MAVHGALIADFTLPGAMPDWRAAANSSAGNTPWRPHRRSGKVGDMKYLLLMLAVAVLLVTGGCILVPEGGGGGGGHSYDGGRGHDEHYYGGDHGGSQGYTDRGDNH
jgi:hypothetical protein